MAGVLGGSFNQTPRDYQEAGIARALAVSPGERLLIASPCGSGKGSLALHIARAYREAGKSVVILTPSLEIVRGFFERCGVDVGDLSDNRLRALAESHELYTPVTFRARYENGAASAPDVVIADECHHATESDDTVAGDLFAYFPEATWIGLTATPFRGTPRSTKALRDAWGEPYVVATLPQMIERGYVMLPRFRVVPLLDDDQVTVTKGAFRVGGKSGAGGFVASRARGIAELVGDFVTNGVTDMPTCVVAPSREAAGRICEELDALGIGWRLVIGTTKATERAAAYALCEINSVVLVTVNVLAEGVDLPWLGRLIDCSPTMSPVAWLQRIGRVMRPKEVRPEILVCCRNLERWAFLLAGALPSEVIYEAQSAFEAPSKRSGFRSLGFERLGRFKPLRLPLANGCEGQAFMLVSHDEDGVQTEYCILATDTNPNPIAATRTNGVKPSGERDYGTWHACEVPVGLEGFATSSQRGELSPKQANWWRRAARRHGLDPDAEVSRREFAALPVLTQTKLRLD